MNLANQFKQHNTWQLAYADYPKFQNTKLKTVKNQLQKLTDPNKIQINQHFVELSQLYQDLYNLQTFQTQIYQCLNDQHFLISEYQINGQYESLILNSHHTQIRLKQLFNKLNIQLKNQLPQKTDLNQIYQRFIQNFNKVNYNLMVPNQTFQAAKIYDFANILNQIDALNAIKPEDVLKLRPNKLKEIKKQNLKIYHHLPLTVNGRNKQWQKNKKWQQNIVTWFQFLNLICQLQTNIVQNYIDHVIQPIDRRFVHDLIYINYIPNHKQINQLKRKIKNKHP